MKKLVKESLNEGFQDKLGSWTEEQIISAIKKHCETIVTGTEEYFKSLEDEGIDSDNLDIDEVENYVSNESAYNVAHQILEIINNRI